MKKLCGIFLFIFIVNGFCFAQQKVEAHKDSFNGFGLGADVGYWNAPSVGFTLVNRFASNWHFAVGVSALFDADYTESDFAPVYTRDVQPSWADLGNHTTSNLTEIFIKIGRRVWGKFGLEAGVGYTFQSQSHLYWNNPSGDRFGTLPSTHNMWTAMGSVTYNLTDTVMLSLGGHSKRGAVFGVTLFAP